VLLPATVRGTLSRERRDADTLFCACWTLGVIVFFSLAQGKLGTYILPALPPLALLTGRYVDDLRHTAQPSSTDRRLVGGGMLIAATLCIVAWPVVLALSARVYDGAWMRISTLAAVLLPFGAALVALVRRDLHRLTPAVLAFTFALALVVFYRWGAPAISAVRSEEPLARIIAQHAPSSTASPLVAFRVRTPSLLFYTQRRVREIDQPGRLARVVAKHPLVFVITSAKHVPVLSQHVMLFPWHTTGRHILYASRPLPTLPPGTEPRSTAP
jgi:4-amino-4-deoxy-L-arabinose transferase